MQGRRRRERRLRGRRSKLRAGLRVGLAVDSCRISEKVRRAHAERALEENVFALLATKATGASARSAWAALDAAAYALGAGSQLHARSLGDLWASSTWSRIGRMIVE